jgi:hypothetical protein
MLLTSPREQLYRTIRYASNPDPELIIFPKAVDEEILISCIKRRLSTRNPKDSKAETEGIRRETYNNGSYNCMYELTSDIRA